MDYEAHPLTRRILDEPIPSRFRMSQLDLYDGTMDLLDHFKSYKALMQLQDAIDALCVAFPAMLHKAVGACTPDSSRGS